MTIKKILIQINKRWLSSIDCSTYEQVLSAVDRASRKRKLKISRKRYTLKNKDPV